MQQLGGPQPTDWIVGVWMGHSDWRPMKGVSGYREPNYPAMSRNNDPAD